MRMRCLHYTVDINLCSFSSMVARRYEYVYTEIRGGEIIVYLYGDAQQDAIRKGLSWAHFGHQAHESFLLANDELSQ